MRGFLFPTSLATMEGFSSPGSLERGAAELKGLGIGRVSLHPHRAGGWSSLLLLFELLLAFHGQQLSCTPVMCLLGKVLVAGGL